MKRMRFLIVIVANVFIVGNVDAALAACAGVTPCDVRSLEATLGIERCYCKAIIIRNCISGIFDISTHLMALEQFQESRESALEKLKFPSSPQPTGRALRFNACVVGMLNIYSQHLQEFQGGCLASEDFSAMRIVLEYLLYAEMKALKQGEKSLIFGEQLIRQVDWLMRYISHKTGNLEVRILEGSFDTNAINHRIEILRDVLSSVRNNEKIRECLNCLATYISSEEYQMRKYGQDSGVESKLRSLFCAVQRLKCDLKNI